MEEFDQLLEPGNIGFYKSCKVTIIMLHDKRNKTCRNLFTHYFFQETEIVFPKVQFIDKLLPIDENLRIGTLWFEVDLTEARNRFRDLKEKNNWTSTKFPDLIIDSLKLLPPKYVGNFHAFRENTFLISNENGCYWLEFFNEIKREIESFYSALDEESFRKIAAIIKERCKMDISKCKDRTGNIIFQFPITLLKVDGKFGETGDDLTMFFEWHKNTDGSRPSCFIQGECLSENSLVTFFCEPYNGQSHQTIPGDHTDYPLKVRILRTKPNLLLQEWLCHCASPTGLVVTYTHTPPETRDFTTKGEKHSVIIKHMAKTYNPLDHSEHSKMAVYRANSVETFKEFEHGQELEATNYLRYLVGHTHSPEIMMYDPYLNADDILNFLFFSEVANRPLRAIGSFNREVRKGRDIKETDVTGYIASQEKILNDPKNTKTRLQLEFRVQHGNFGLPMHDRFLMFKGNSQDPPEVFSVGTSFNSVGKSHHVIIKLLHPQNLIDKFENLWKQLEDKSCLVYKFP